MGSAREGSNPFAVAFLEASAGWGWRMRPGFGARATRATEHSSVGRAFDCRRCGYRMVPGSIPGVRSYFIAGPSPEVQDSRGVV